MNPELFYERGWATCAECQTRRPVAKLKDGRRADDWHAVMFLRGRAAK